MSDKKIALILPNNVWFCPYVSIYTDVLKADGVSYDIISWNRDGKKEDAVQYNYVLKSRNTLMLLWAYKKFSSFIKKTIKKKKYDLLIIFTPQVGIFLYKFLRKEFKGKYIFDYRDLSIEQKLIFKFPFLKVLQNSFANVISSPGFIRFLPKEFNYFLSHNFNVYEVRRTLNSNIEVMLKENPIDVLTIGGIRDYESNVQIIENLANVDGFIVRFIGKGPSAGALQKRSEELKATNLIFEGYYPKSKEKEYVKDATFLNIFYPRKPSHDAAISNRFYNSLIFRKPMITTKNTIQGDYTEKYNVGIAISDCGNLSCDLKNYIASMDVDRFCENCDTLLKDFLKDYEAWKNMLQDFLKVNNV